MTSPSMIDPRPDDVPKYLKWLNRRLYNLEKRLRIDTGGETPGCCEEYCVYATPGGTIGTFVTTNVLTLAVPAHTSCRLSIDWCIDFSQASSGNFGFQPQLFVDSHVRRPIMPFFRTSAGAGDQQPVSGTDVIDILGRAADCSVVLQVANTGVNTITLQDGMMKIQKFGRTGSISCAPGQVGQ